ncbi:S8 family peptidase [Nonomuraea rhodomycinica]|uniref:S8 family serine peptidase n=1 Tax=Nonomuraea rhodomycinica TaxID=1712872 RepID=A0A7Y6MFL8_9ACTN|nr:S8 family serine peptidase [Nonomuraea rhodomycinica]NUW46863.1 S8 family serine peptidase [Nonomuraea rhodomycinica]
MRPAGKIVGVAAVLLLLAARPAQAGAGRDWHLAAMRVPAARTMAEGEGVTVAVLDSGVVAGHPAFRGRVSTGPDLIGGGARPGQPYWGAHGTAMASDVLSVAPRARVLSVRVIWDREDPARDRFDEAVKKWARTREIAPEVKKSQQALARGIRYAVAHGAKVISMSLGTDEWGAFQPYEEDVAAAVGHAVGKGVVLLASSGNGGSSDLADPDANNVVSYPAAYPGVIAVAAMGPDGRRAEFSQVHTYTTIAAPGVDIASASNTGGYRLVNGTSPACALAAGAVALMVSRAPGLSPRQVRRILVDTAIKPSRGYTPFLGHGLIDAEAAVRAAARTRPAETAAAPWEGGERFAMEPVDDRVDHPPVDPVYLAAGGAGAVFGLGCWLGAFFLLRRPRHRRARTSPTG